MFKHNIKIKPLKELKNILRHHKDEIRTRFKVKEIGIFGSYVKGEAHKKSDVDVLVEFSEPVGLFEFMDLEDYLQEILETKIDLVSKKALKPHIGEHILKEVVYI